MSGSGLVDWLTVDSETLLLVADEANETELVQQQTLFYHHKAPDDSFLHGRRYRQAVSLNGKTNITDYQYKPLNSVTAGEQVLQTVETITGWDNARKVITREDSLIHAQPLLTYDDNHVTIRYTYDVLARVTSETVAPGHPDFEATRYYQYFLTSVYGGQAQQLLVDVKGVTTRTLFDGMNRAISEERQNADSPDRADAYRQTYSALHDSLGNLVEETHYDWRNEEQVPQTSVFDYDPWGNLRSTIGPDGVKEHDETDPIGTRESKGPIQRKWREGPGANPLISGVSVTWFNLFEKPTRTLRLDSPMADAKVSSVHEYIYDGLGRTQEEINPLKAKTQYSYDVYNRIVTTTLPGGAVVRRRYDEYSSEDRPIEISVNGILHGKQAFDTLGRMTSSITGGREQTFTYKPGEMQPESVTTAQGQVINYEYQPLLGEEPIERRLPDQVDAQYNYDKKTARLISCKEQGQQLLRQYFSTGELKSETRQSGDETPYVMHYNHSRQGLLLSYIDVLNNTQRYHYDQAGRLQFTEMVSDEAGTEVTTLVSKFTYDGLGQTQSIETQDCISGRSVTITMKYDVFGREIARTFDLDGIIQQMTQVYDENDLLVQRNLREGKNILRSETYDYDPRGRLEIYKCQGSQPPVDPYGKAIAIQWFRFDAHDNITQVITEATDGTSNDARYHFDKEKDPTQLLKVTNSAGEPYPSEILLCYDRNGNLIRDEENRILEYDALNRLLSVSEKSGGGSSDFEYDALDKLSGLNGGAEQRFYQKEDLATRIDGDLRQSFVRADGNLLAEQQEGAGPKLQLLASDQKNTVLCEVSSDVTNDFAYSAYGHCGAERPVSTRLGYNGMLREMHFGWYLLGNGYRAYNPCLMRFHSPDRLSPFGEGGSNAYTYCEGNPIGFVDPTGEVGTSVFNWLKGFLNRPINVSNPTRRVERQVINSAIKYRETETSAGLDISRDNPLYQSISRPSSKSSNSVVKESAFPDDYSVASDSISSKSLSDRSSVVDHLYAEIRTPGGSKMQTLDRQPRAREPLPHERRTKAPAKSQQAIRNEAQALNDRIERARRTEGKRL
ncbi:RHS repeat domain-containing protein [Pseudomonas umsongensis]|uniref:RHS repeat domain-containing protein n=1 Tax=Pseudomonas umsongensis TaxID=198618 RepID=UPI001C4B6A67|nr:RHS repeat-associated core domain-containing protein [Pseudomonas umsongensis]